MCVPLIFLSLVPNFLLISFIYVDRTPSKLLSLLIRLNKISFSYIRLVIKQMKHCEEHFFSAPKQLNEAVHWYRETAAFMSDLCCVIDCFRLVISIYVIIHGVITSAEEVMFSPVTTGWFLCQPNTQKLLKRFFMKLGGWVSAQNGLHRIWIEIFSHFLWHCKIGIFWLISQGLMLGRLDLVRLNYG